MFAKITEKYLYLRGFFRNSHQELHEFLHKLTVWEILVQPRYVSGSAHIFSPVAYQNMGTSKIQII